MGTIRIQRNISLNISRFSPSHRPFSRFLCCQYPTLHYLHTMSLNLLALYLFSFFNFPHSFSNVVALTLLFSLSSGSRMGVFPSYIFTLRYFAHTLSFYHSLSLSAYLNLLQNLISLSRSYLANFGFLSRVFDFRIQFLLGGFELL